MNDFLKIVIITTVTILVLFAVAGLFDSKEEKLQAQLQEQAINQEQLIIALEAMQDNIELLRRELNRRTNGGIKFSISDPLYGLREKERR